MPKSLLLIATIASMLAACAHSVSGSLQPGVATEAEVRAKLGAPGMVWNDPDGGRLLEYSGQPSGTFCHMILIGADGKVREVRQAFTEENFRRVVPGLKQDEVRRLLGRPEETLRYPLKPDEEVWSWRIEDTTEKTVHFNAYFGRDGRLLRSERSIFYKASGPGFTRGVFDRHSLRG